MASLKNKKAVDMTSDELLRVMSYIRDHYNSMGWDYRKSARYKELCNSYNDIIKNVANLGDYDIIVDDETLIARIKPCRTYRQLLKPIKEIK